MEFMSKLRWVLVVIVLIIVLVLVGWGLASIARNVFDTEDTAQETTQTEEDADELALASATIVSFSTDGPIVANADHRSYTIDVTPQKVTMRVYASYGQSLLKEKVYPNTQTSYDNFISSLRSSNATDRIEGTTVEDDYADQGVCPTGKRYIFTVANGEVRRWSTSCGSSTRNAQGTGVNRLSTVRTLFEKQVPDYTDMVSGTGL